MTHRIPRHAARPALAAAAALALLAVAPPAARAASAAPAPHAVPTPHAAPVAPVVPAALAGTAALVEQALAQAAGEVGRVIEQHLEWRLDDPGSGDLHGFAAGEMGGRLVKGAPYCADAVHETSQTLLDADGKPANRIARRQTTRLCRDGEGRTRQEVERGGRRLVYLRDPVAGTSWVLEPDRKTARRLGLSGSLGLPGHGGAGAADASAWREFNERMREFGERMRDWARSNRDALRQGTATTPQPVAPVPPTPPVPPVPGAAPVVITQSERDGQRNVEVHVIRSGDGAAPAPGAVRIEAPALGFADTLRRWAPRGQGAVTPLGSKEIEGLRVNGERTTWTIDAGKVDNDKPIVIVREVWTSPDLMLTVQSRDFDPRSGEVSYRLTQVRRGEPDAALFKVPEDYAQGRTGREPRPPRAPSAPAAPAAPAVKS